MNLHKDARTPPHGRLLMVRRVLEQKQPRKVAADCGVSQLTVRQMAGALTTGRRAGPQ
jgi:hypothetical protein